MAKYSGKCPPCGHVFEAETADEYVRIVAQHAKTNHQATFSREEILSRAVVKPN
jgi:predicted small metal-binding protein